MNATKTLAALAAAAICAAFAPIASQAGTNADWRGGSGGTEAEPLEIYNKNNWSSGVLPSSSYNLRFSVDAPTVLTNSAGIATKIADWVQFTSGDFTVLGDVQMSVLGWSQPAGTATVVKKGDWLVTHEFTLGYNSGSHFTLTNACGNMKRTNAGSPFDIARAANTTVIVENLSGDWNITANDFYVGSGSSSRGELHFRSGNFAVSGNLRIGTGGNSVGIVEFLSDGGTMSLGKFVNVGTGGTGYLTIGPGSATQSSAYIQLGHTSTGVMTVKRGGKYTRIGEQDGASMWMSMENGASGTLNVEGGEVLLGGTLGIHYRGSTGDTAINVTEGGVLTMSRIWQKTTGSTTTVTLDDGMLRAYANRSDFLPDALNLVVKVGNGGATFDCDGHDITIAKAIEDATGASGPVTFAGNDGKIRLTGALNTTGAIKLCDRTHLIAKDATMKAAILTRGITVVKPIHGSAKGTFTIFSVADGTPCTDADLANVTFGPGLTGAVLSIVDGAITITVTHSSQTWSGPAGASAPWSGANWDGGELFDDGNEALFATANAIAEVDSEANALSLTFNADATLTGTGTLTAPTVDVASGVTATISAPTAESLTKTGAGTLVLGASRAAQTTLSEGTLVMSPGATLGSLVLGKDSAKPLTLDYGGGTLAVQSANLMGANCTATFKNGTFGTSGDFNIDNGKTLRLGTGARMTVSGYVHINKGVFEIDGGAVTNTARYFEIGHDNVGTMTVKNGGRFVGIGGGDGAKLWIALTGSGSGTLNITDGGEVFLDGDLGFHYYGGSGVCAVNVTDGGVLTMSRMYQRSGSSAVNVLIDGGTFRAYADNTAFISNASYLSLTVGANGGTIDANGKRITVAKQVSGVGGVTYKGRGAVTLSQPVAYSGKTTVEVGTSLVVPASISGANLAFTIPEGLEPGVYEVVSVSGNGSFAADVISTATLPSDPNARFVLVRNAKTIYCIYGTVNEQVWIGGASGNLNDAGGWLTGAVPTGGEAIIGNATAATLANGAGFTPDTITFHADSAKVTITGTDPITTVSTIINHSAIAHEFACPVSGSAITFNNDTTSCNFSGGITVETPTFTNRGSGKSDLSGTWRITAANWTPSSGCRINSGGSVTVEGTLLNSANISINAGGVLTAAAYRATNTYYPAYDNNGQLVVNGIMNISNTSQDFSLARDNGQNSTVIAGGIVYNTGKWAWLNAKAIVVGEDGISVSGTYQPELRFSNSSTLYARDGVLTLHSVPHKYSIAGGQNVTFDTTKYGTADVPATFMIDGKINENRTDGYIGGMVVRGCGKVVFNSASTFIGGLTVTDTATVAVNADCKPGNGAVTLADTATLTVAQSGTATLGGALSVASGATLAFNFTNKRVAPVLTGTSVAVSGDTVNVKVTASDDASMNGGTFTLTSGMDFTGKMVNVIDKPKWVKSVQVVNGDIVAAIKSAGTVLFVR